MVSGSSRPLLGGKERITTDTSTIVGSGRVIDAGAALNNVSDNFRGRPAVCDCKGVVAINNNSERSVFSPMIYEFRRSVFPGFSTFTDKRRIRTVQAFCTAARRMCRQMIRKYVGEQEKQGGRGEKEGGFR